jgi:uncharacterized membrane protein (DUF106 family)
MKNYELALIVKNLQEMMKVMQDDIKELKNDRNNIKG